MIRNLFLKTVHKPLLQNFQNRKSKTWCTHVTLLTIQIAPVNHQFYESIFRL